MCPESQSSRPVGVLASAARCRKAEAFLNLAPIYVRLLLFLLVSCVLRVIRFHDGVDGVFQGAGRFHARLVPVQWPGRPIGADSDFRGEA